MSKCGQGSQKDTCLVYIPAFTGRDVPIFSLCSSSLANRAAVPGKQSGNSLKMEPCLYERPCKRRISLLLVGVAKLVNVSALKPNSDSNLARSRPCENIPNATHAVRSTHLTLIRSRRLFVGMRQAWIVVEVITIPHPATYLGRAYSAGESEHSAAHLFPL